MSFRLFLLPALAAGLMFAQGPPAQRGPRAGQGMRRGAPLMQRLNRFLNLSNDQMQQARGIFSDARQQAQPVQQQLRTQRQNVADAIKSGASDSDLDKIAANVGPLTSQLAAIHAKAFAKFYAILTADQKTKFNNLLDAFLPGVWGPRAQRPAGE